MILDIWFDENGNIHRADDLPAVTDYIHCIKLWMVNGEIHRDNDKYAAVIGNRKRLWYKNGRIHRENTPAIVGRNGNEAYYHDGVFEKIVIHKKINLNVKFIKDEHFGSYNNNHDLDNKIYGPIDDPDFKACMKYTPQTCTDFNGYVRMLNSLSRIHNKIESRVWNNFIDINIPKIDDWFEKNFTRSDEDISNITRYMRVYREELDSECPDHFIVYCYDSESESVDSSSGYSSSNDREQDNLGDWDTNLSDDDSNEFADESSDVECDYPSENSFNEDSE
jgi:hypothetical protein